MMTEDRTAARREWAQRTVGDLIATLRLYDSEEECAEVAIHYLSEAWHNGWLVGYADAEPGSTEVSADPFRAQR